MAEAEGDVAKRLFPSGGRAHETRAEMERFSIGTLLLRVNIVDNKIFLFIFWIVELELSM